MQKKYQDSEKLLSSIPLNLREQVIAKTHGDVLQKIKFFQNKSQEFQNAIVHELKPINLGKGELLYQQGDTCSDLYFIHTGTVKLYIEVIDYISDDRDLALIRDMEQRRKRAME